eukprot:jgi/Ulvmu1/11050/UM007_0232.1
MADSSSGDVNQATPDDPPPTAQHPIQPAPAAEPPGAIVHPSLNPDRDPATYPFLFSPEATTEAPGAADIESLARSRFAPASAAHGPGSWPRDAAAGAQDSTSAAIASLLYPSQGSDTPVFPRQPHGGSPDPSLAAIQAAVTGLDSGDILGGYAMQRPAQMAARSGSARDADAEPASSSGGAGSGHNPQQRSHHRSGTKSGGRSSRRGRGRDDEGSDVDAATERRRRRRERGKEQRGEEKAMLQALQDKEAALSAAVQSLRQQWQVLNALGAVGLRQVSPTFVARYTSMETSLAAAQDSIAVNLQSTDSVALQAANNSAVQALLELSALRQELVRSGGEMLDLVGAPSLTLGRTYSSVALGEAPLSTWMAHFLATSAASSGLPLDVLSACEGLQRSWADAERHTQRALNAALEDDAAQRMRDVIGGIAARIYPAGSSFVLVPPQMEGGPARGMLPAALQQQPGLPPEAGRTGTLISSGSLPQRGPPGADSVRGMWGGLSQQEANMLTGIPSSRAGGTGGQIPPDSPLSFASEPPFMQRRGGGAGAGHMPPIPSQGPGGSSGGGGQRPHDVVSALLIERHVFRSNALIQVQGLLPPLALGQFLLSASMFDEPVKALATALDSAAEPGQAQAATAAAAVSALRAAELLL